MTRVNLSAHLYRPNSLPTPFFLWFWVAWFASLGADIRSAAAADSGYTLSGTIVESTGQPISGAHVQLNAAETQSDPKGYYYFSGLEHGSHSLTISAMGYQPRAITLDLIEQKTSVPTITLDHENGVVMDKLTVTEQVSAASFAFADKTSTDSVKETISGAALTRNGAQDASDALKGVAGVTVTRASDGSSNVSIRGLAPQFNRVTVDGQRQSNAGKFNSGTALDSLPPEILESIEVTKSLTPDMDADAIGGVISLSTTNASELKKPLLQLKEQLVEGSIGRHVGTRSTFTAGRPFQLWSKKPDSGVLLTFSFDDVYRARQGIETLGNWPTLISPGPNPWSGTAVPAFTNVNIEDTLDHRKRSALLFNADTRVGNSSFYLKSNYTNDAINRTRGQFLFDVSQGTPLSLTPDNATFSGVPLFLHGIERNATRDVSTISIGEKTELNRIHIMGSVGFTRTADREPNTLDAGFMTEDPFTVTYDGRDDSLLPHIYYADSNVSSNAGAVLKPSQYAFNQLIVNKSLAVDKNYSAQADVKIDLSKDPQASYLKFGVKALRFDRSVNQDRSVYDPNAAAAPFTAVGLVRTAETTFQNGGYQFGPVTNPYAVASLVSNQPSLFQLNQTDTQLSSTTSDYHAHETIWAAYSMGRVVWRNWSFLAGVRVEGTQFDTSASQPLFNSTGSLLGFNSLAGGRSYVNVLPGLHLRYEPTPGLIFRGSVNRTLTRPNYGDLAPFLDINFTQRELRIGNPALNPYNATNFDYSADYYREDLGLFSAGLFYKTIKNFQVDSQRLVTLGNLGQFQQMQRINGDTAHVGGAELSWKSRSWEIPEVANKISLGLTYTYSKSASHVPGRGGETFPLPLQARNQLSASVHAERKIFSLDLGVTYHTKMLDSIIGYDRDQYEKGIVNVDLSGTVKIRKNIGLTLGVRNLTAARSRTYDGDPSRLKETQFSGCEFNLGLNWKL